MLDEFGDDTAPPFPLPTLNDDVDALTEPPTSYVDPDPPTDGDGYPDYPVYFSLGTGSPTLDKISATPADILMNMTVVGLPVLSPTIVISAASLGLVSGDDIDAFCLDATGVTTRAVLLTTEDLLFSLAPDSPSLNGPDGESDTGDDFSPSDIFRSGLELFASAAELGLEPTDNLNALKCTKPLLEEYYLPLIWKN